MTNLDTIKWAADLFKEQHDTVDRVDSDQCKKSFDIKAYLKQYGIEFTEKKAKYIIQCPFNYDHGKDAAVWQNSDGKLCFHCFHDGCSEKGWKEFRSKVSGDSPIIKNEPSIHSKLTTVNNSTKDSDLWDYASERFPHRHFPWGVFPASIAESLQQAARSCATSDIAMPGAAFAIMGSCLGRTISVSPKPSWEEPQIYWNGDIRDSGQGKTPLVHMLLGPIHQVQRKTDEHYQEELDTWEANPKKNKGPKPKRPGAHFATDLTLEGLRMDVMQGNGGMVCVLDELSAMISSQNQYKNKGNDRENWLKLFDGHDARISRAGQSFSIRGSRISIFGGIQPSVFKAKFGGDQQLYIYDGAVFRFLLTYQKNSFVPLTDESWSEGNRQSWESTINKAMAWADGVSSCEEKEHLVMRMTDDARKYLWSYRNNLIKETNLFPPELRGFMPKSISYIPRIAGNLACFSCFSNDMEPSPIITDEDLWKVISVTEFYLAHTVSAIRLMVGDTGVADVNEMTVRLAKTLAIARNDLDSGRLAVGYLYDKFNEQCAPVHKLKSDKAMGTLLRAHGLTISPGKHEANGRRGVHCLIWDSKVEELVRTLQTSIGQSLHLETSANTESADIADIVQEEEYEIEGNIL